LSFGTFCGRLAYIFPFWIVVPQKNLATLVLTTIGGTKHVPPQIGHFRILQLKFTNVQQHQYNPPATFLIRQFYNEKNAKKTGYTVPSGTNVKTFKIFSPKIVVLLKILLLCAII
jgi:hypothetical protein